MIRSMVFNLQEKVAKGDTEYEELKAIGERRFDAPTNRTREKWGSLSTKVKAVEDALAAARASG